jgi:16S rRNA (uracil1498-N3)-methyltransferase
VRRPRVFLPTAPAPGERLSLPAVDGRHLGRVLRLRPGAALTGVAPDGQEFELRWAGEGAAWVVAALPAAGPEPSVPVTLALAVPAAGRMDWVVEKAVEIGAAAIQPLLAERGIPDARVGGGHPARWERLARAAAAQSGRRTVPAVLPPGEPAAVLGGFRRAKLVAQPGAAPLPEAPGGPVLVAVGPEGGWTGGELAAARAVGARLWGLGPTTLRVETAGLVALTLLLHAGVAPRTP